MGNLSQKGCFTYPVQHLHFALMFLSIEYFRTTITLTILGYRKALENWPKKLAVRWSRLVSLYYIVFRQKKHENL